MPILLTHVDVENGKLFLRRKNDEIDLSILQNDLENYYFTLRHNDQKPDVMEIGDVVAVKVYRTQAWHRAKIIQNFQHPKLGDSFRVNLLDKVSFYDKKINFWRSI